jgi:hypothetical protein
MAISKELLKTAEFLTQPSDADMQKAIDDDLDVVGAVAGEILSDDENESKNLVEFYKELDTEQRKIVDLTMMFLTGWSFGSMLQRSYPNVDNVEVEVG